MAAHGSSTQAPPSQTCPAPQPSEAHGSTAQPPPRQRLPGGQLTSAHASAAQAPSNPQRCPAGQATKAQEGTHCPSRQNVPAAQEIPLHGSSLQNPSRQRRPGEQPVTRFSGWMFASSPALSAMEHPVYDVWVLDCKNASSAASETSR